MARIRTVDFLPEIFKTDVNREFLGATLDQLVQEPELKRTQGYIGRRFGPGTRYNDSYVIEDTAIRTNYQFEPAVVFNNSDNQTQDAITYPGIIDALETAGANVTRHDRLFASETYSWDPSIDLDKFINYGQYYWLPAGPDAVDIQNSTIAETDEFAVTSDDNDRYNFTDIVGGNPVLSLVRGGTYTFEVNQDSGFWIQSEAGVDGTLNYSPNISSRAVAGVANNGATTGTVTFNVPEADAQQYYHDLTDLGTVDFATMDRYDSINAQLLENFAGIDGVTDVEGRTVVFLNSQTGDSYDLGWQRIGLFDADNQNYDKTAFEPTVYLDTLEERYSIFRINVIRPDGSSDAGAFIDLSPIPVDIESKFTIGFGAEYSNRTFFKNQSGFFEEQPLLTAANDFLYYQDGTQANKFGVIKLVDSEGAQTIDIAAEILGQTEYVSPNGVILTNGLKVVFRGSVTPTSYQNNEYYVDGVGESITLTLVDDLYTVSAYHNNMPGSNNQPQDPDYITIKRDAINYNHWSRSNRWFHVDVINKTAEYNNTVATFDNDYRAKRPIIEFDSALKLYNTGTYNTQPIDVIDFNTTDALSLVHGSSGYSIDGHFLANGSRVVFANDADLTVRNKIYEVTLVDPDDDSTEFGTIVNLQLADDAQVYDNQIVYCLSGNTQEGEQYYYINEEWKQCQRKTAINQAPLFDVFDANGYSYSDTTRYPSTTFAGSKLFSYKVGTTVAVDPVLGFSLTYENIDNIGDIVFESNQQTDTFVYVSDSTSTTVNVNDGYIRKYSDRTTYTTGCGWVTSADKNWQRQVFTFQYDGSTPLYTDVAARTDLNIPAVKVYVENKFVLPSTYSVAIVNGQTTITFNSTSTIKANDIVQVKIISQSASSVAYYEVPSNLESNIFNQDKQTFTLGTIRNHYNRLIENANEFTGVANGINNTRDIGNLESYGDVIVQHSAPVAAAAFFLRNQKYDFFNALEKSARDYQNFKNQILNWVNNNDVYGLTAAQILDAALADINVGKTDSTAYYWGDMIPFGGDYIEDRNEITVISTRNFNTVNVYDFTKANTLGLLVYHNDQILLKDDDYTVATDGPRITLQFDPAIGDTITIREYATTYGSYVPPTPTKLGLYPEKDPFIYTDYTYIEPRTVVQGHDGSITIGFDDIRDDVLLEFERRVYNNLKHEGNALPIEPADVLQGEFRNTEFSLGETNEILAESFLDWTGWNKLDYKTQDYRANNEWTWNYSTAVCTLDGSLLPGHWRGIYSKYYDTDHPHVHPWEMLGFIDEPHWWSDVYGPAPYTSGNLVMWEDLEAGYNRNADTYDERYARPGLTTIIPVDSEGNLAPPLAVLVANYNSLDFKKSWNFGDGGPVETAWRRSSAFPFAMQKLYALTKPAEYFALMADRDRNQFDASMNQYVYDGRHRYNFAETEIFDVDVFKHSYINWIVENNRATGITESSALAADIENTDIRLTYRLGGYSDKKYLKIYTDKTSPDSSNASLLVPDESFQLLLYKNQAFVDLQYSSVMIQKTSSGYAVYGNSQTDAYFRILKSAPGNDYTTFYFGSKQYRLPKRFTDTVVRVPYGYSFTNENSVIDFLVSYGAYLESQGLVFEHSENNTAINWGQMANEFVHWANQGWDDGALININPAADLLEFNRPLTVVDNLNNLAVNELPLDQNRTPMTGRDYAVTRIDNQFKIQGLTNKSLSYLRVKGVSYEHLLVLDNRSIFNDLVYDPVTGLRQQRIRVDGFKTANWDGQVNARGFILNQDNVASWVANLAYNKGDIVKYKNAYWTANSKLQPAEEFSFDDWIKIDYDAIDKGLLSNIANKADEIHNYYNNSVANLETDADLLGLGLTGFRKRDYMESMNLPDISQVKVYQNLVENKGTPATAELFQNAQFDKETSEYNIYENWAVRRATYGGNANKRFVELALDNSLLRSNPSVIEITNDVSNASQVIEIDSIYKQSVKNNNTNIFPELTEELTDTSLPTAGFVNANDVDISIFSLNDLSGITQSIDSVQQGAYVWVARKNVYDWDVYRCSAIEPNEMTVIDNLNGTLSITFESDHNLIKGQVIVIKQLSTLINAAHRVGEVNDIRTITIDGTLSQNATTIEGRGVVYKLTSARLAKASDAIDLPYSNEILAGDKIWVDSDINGLWRVYEKTNPFTNTDSQLPTGATSNIQFASSIAQGLNNSGLIVGAPTYETNGGLFCYNRDSDTYKYTATINDVNGVEEYGASVSFAESWAVVGAPGTEVYEGCAVVINRDAARNVFQEWQVLIAPTADLGVAGAGLGRAVVISEDEHWIYASAPGQDKVYAYQLIQYQDQSFTVVSDGNTAAYNLDNLIRVDEKAQLLVTVDDVVLATNQYNLVANILTINDVPAQGTVITVERRKQITVNGDGSTVDFDTTQLFGAQSLESVQVYVDGILQRPYYDYSFASNTITFVTAPSSGESVTIRAADYYRYTNTITGTSSEGFGVSVATTSDGQQLLVGADLATVDGLVEAGKVYVYERLVERLIVTNATQRTYVTRRTIDTLTDVHVNDAHILNTTNDVGSETVTINETLLPDSSVTYNSITFSDAVEFTVGDNIEVDINEINLVQTLVLDNNNQGAKFGQSLSVCRTDCSLYVGAPSDNWVVPEGGSVSRFLNGSRVYGTLTGTQANPTLTVTDTIRIDNIDVAMTGTTVEQAAEDINNAIIPNVHAFVTDGKLTIDLVNHSEAPVLSKLTIMPGAGTAFADLGLEPFTNVQTIRSPVEYEYAHFGNSVHVDYTAINLVVGADRGHTLLPTTFDGTLKTINDSGSTRYLDEVVESGAVYTFDLLPGSSTSEAGKLVFGQQIFDSSISELDRFGAAVSYVDGLLVVASPAYSTSVNNIGRIVMFENSTQSAAWTSIQNQPMIVDSRKMNYCYIYDADTQNVKTYLDFIDPINGKLLGVVKENLDFITPNDPAIYNTAGKKNGIVWISAHVGQIWWDTSNARLLDYNQSDAAYASKILGTMFEGSTVDVYEWIESSVPPAESVYEVKSVDEYSSVTGIDTDRTIVTKYYFWAKTSVVNKNAGKTLSASVIADYIENPVSAGIPFAAFMRKNVIALYNVDEYLQDNKKSILHAEYNQTLRDQNVFVEFDLIKAGDRNSFMSDSIWRKMKDSLCGVDQLGNIVPDVGLSPTDRYGVQFRPRQSMFKDRYAALDTFLNAANELLASQPFSELRTFNLLVAEESYPLANTGVWDSRVVDLTELSYQDTAVDGAGYKYLVETDADNSGLWTIYEVQSDFSLALVRVQSYKTDRYWDYANWYASGYSALTKPKKIVNTYSELLTLTESDKTVVKVLTNSDNKWELYVYSTATDTWSRIGLEDGTIQLRSALWDYSQDNNGFDREVFDVQYFDEEPVIELRNILEALAYEVLIGDFLYFRNELMIVAFDYILFEQGKVDWLYKTSLIDVSHKVRNLDQYPTYRKDNQDFVLDYITEAKPYHVQIKEFLTRYDGVDVVGGNVYDYDVPSAYNASFAQFVSPVLEDDYAVLETDVSNTKETSTVWSTRPWSDWYVNHKLSIDRIVITNPGSGYTLPPVVTITGDADTPATGIATINEDGEVTGITITNYGSTYRNTPMVLLSGGNGTGATAAVYTKQDVVRTLNTTIKYDRYDYNSDIIEWEANTVYNTNDLVRYNNRVYRAINADGSTPSDSTFDPLDYQLVPASTLSGIDRTMGFYVADVNKTGLDLALLINGIDYPGVQLKGPGFEYNSGYSVGNYDLTVFDNIEYGPEGLPTYSETILDNEIFTSFTGTYTGIDLSGIDSVQATAVASISGLEVTSIVATEVGKGYSADVPPTLVISAPRDNLTATALAATNGWELTNINVTSSGFGYLTAPTVTITEQPPSPGVTAQGTVELAAGSVGYVLLDNSGAGYTSPPTVTFSDPPSVAASRATATVTALTSTGGVSTTNVTLGGNSYTTSPAVTVTAPPASVTATGTVTKNAYDIISATVTTAGNYYSVAPTVTVESPTAIAVQATASATIGGGGVTTISVDQPGHMYQTAPAVTITPAAATTGNTATATATLDLDISGFDTDDGFDAVAFEAEGGVGTITVVVPGDGYTVAPVVTISAPDLSGGTQATATANISGDSAPLYTGDGYVVSITVTEPGTGYTSAPTVTIAAPDTLINHGVGAVATATISNTDVISITVVSVGSHYDITPTITLDPPTTPYAATVTAAVSGGQVTGLTVSDAGWGYETTPAITIAAPDVTPVTAAFTANLTGDAVTSLTVDTAGSGYLTAPTLTIDTDPSVAGDIATGTAVMTNGNVASVTITNPGANYTVPPSVTFTDPTGLAYHGSGATATATLADDGVASITITNPGSGYDLAPTITISDPTRTTRQATAEPVVVGGGVIDFKITDPGWGYLRTPTVTLGNPSATEPDSDIAGGGFIDAYSSHAPEELVPGSIFDTLDMRVYTRPGYDYSKNGHGWEVKSVGMNYEGAGNDISWDGLIDYPIALVVFDSAGGKHLYESVHYTIDWVNKTIDITSGIAVGQPVKIFVYGIGGANQLFNGAYNGAVVGSTIVIDVDYHDVTSMYIQVNGTEVPLSDGSSASTFSFAQGEFESQTVITFTDSYTATDYISVTVFGDNPSEDSTFEELSYSFPTTQVFTCDGSTNEFTIDADIRFKQRETLIVEHNGFRLQPAAGKRHYGDGSSSSAFALPDGERTGIDMDILTADDVEVYVNEVRQVRNVDWQLDPADGSSFRTVSFLINYPDTDDKIDIYVTKTDGIVIDGVEQPPYARYWIGEGDSAQTLTIVTGNGLLLSAGDTIAVTSFHDSREQDVHTQIYKGAIIVTNATRELWDQYGFDMDLWDRIVGTQTYANLFELDRAVVNTDRMWVTLDGQRLVPSVDYTLSEDGLTMTIVGRGALPETATVVVTTFTNSIVPKALGFRIFKDMRDNVGVYRILDNSQTKLTQELLWTDDVIHVTDASLLSQPNLDAAIFGIVTINGERITYRERDLVNNTISGLRRATAGTAMHRIHSVNSVVIDISSGHAYQPAYANAAKWEKNTAYDAGTIVKFKNTFYRAKIAVPVSYGSTDVFDDDYLYPTVTVFDTTYWEVYEESWYAAGSTTATNGTALQQQTTVAANFFKGI